MKKNSSNPNSFLQKTFEMVSNEAISSIVSWDAEGTQFIIFSLNEFSEKVLPIYFKHNNFASFIRQLNMYDFHKLRSGTSEHIYKHPLFIRNRPDLLKEIHRKTSDSIWPVMQKHNINKTEMSPLINKLVQMHKKNMNYEGQIETLELKVDTLVKKNKLLADELWENKDMLKKIEKALIFFARFLKHTENNEEFSMDFPVLENMLSITEMPNLNLQKKRKIGENLSIPQSPLNYSDFDEEFCPNEKAPNYQAIDSPSDVSFEVDKIDFLLDQ